MIDLEEALSLVRQHCWRMPAAPQSVSEAIGLVLAETVISDIDSPPHDKSMVDGYAVQAADLASGAAVLSVLEEITAGQVPTRKVIAGHATRIMTGAPIPVGADAVVMIEQTELLGDAEQEGEAANALPCVSIRDKAPTVGQHILERGVSVRRGDCLLEAGARLRAIEVGVLSEVGREVCQVYPRPSVGVLSTGDELVEASEQPGPGKIRNSNGPMLSGLSRETGAEVRNLGIAVDDRNELRRLITAGLTSDVLILSGGVSAGVLDLVPSVLAELGVRQVFHKVRLRPGKPLWFGVAAENESRSQRTLVFGLPGNPVSGLVGFLLLVRPALAHLAGRNLWDEPHREAKLTQPHQHRGDRPTFFPAYFQSNPSGLSVTPLPWQGSADLRALTQANCLAHFPPGNQLHTAGQTIQILPLA